jgi:hypothetical protein
MLCHLRKLYHTQSMMLRKSYEVGTATRESLVKLKGAIRQGRARFHALTRQSRNRAMETSHWSGHCLLDAGAVLLPYRAEY